MDDIFGIVTCVSVLDYGICYVCMIGLRNFVGNGDWHTILLLLLNSCLALMFVFSLLFVLQAEEGADRSRAPDDSSAHWPAGRVAASEPTYNSHQCMCARRSGR